jgi:hypothetical protein
MLLKLGAAGGSSNTIASNRASTWVSLMGFQYGLPRGLRLLATIVGFKSSRQQLFIVLNLVLSKSKREK